ncbi:MAG TPA: AAA family ATPase [Polyangiaceae bacterium]
MKVGVMQGNLREFELPHVLEVVGMGRQYFGVEVRRGAGLMGTIFIKGGRVVSVNAPDSEGREALFKLSQLQDGFFYVFRTETPDDLPEPVGALGGLIMEVLDRKDLPATPVAVPTPDPPRVAEPGGLRDAPSLQPPSLHEPLRSAARSEPPRASARPSNPPSAVRSDQPSRAEPSGEHRIVAVASPKGGCGKTTISLNLALSLARQGRSVVLVDGDVNGDILSAIDARQRAEIGVFDVLLGVADVEEALLETILPRFKILPAVGGALPRADSFLADHAPGWQRLLRELAADADIVIVDTPAGMFGVSNQILAASTHVIGVLQAEVVANRSFSRFREGVDALPPGARPEVLGIVVNMLQMRHSASLSVFQSACSDLPAEWLFDTSIPRHRAFLDATSQGVPLRHMDEQAPPAVAFLFDNLAAEVADRLRLGAVERRPRRLLL